MFADRAGASASAQGRKILVKSYSKAAKFSGAGAAGGALVGSPGGWQLSVAGAALVGAPVAFLMARDATHEARRWFQGAAGERRTARAVRRLRRNGWRLHNDRKIEGSNANVDHIWVHPSGTFVFVGDTKAWHAKNALVRWESDHLWYGPWNQTSKIDTIKWETSRVADALGVPAYSIMVLDGGQIDLSAHPDGWIKVDPTFYIVEQRHLVDTLLSVPGGRDVRAARQLSRRINRVLSRKVTRP